MKTTFLLALIALCVLCITLTPCEAARGCVRVARRQCRNNFCWTIYINVCHRRRKRDTSAVENQNENMAPADFRFYDLNQDGRISAKEFDLGMGNDVSYEEGIFAHIQADLNRDGYLSCDEFKLASFPFQLQGEKTC